MSTRKKTRPFPYAKVTPPVLPKVVYRERLFQVIDDAKVPPHNLLWVVAPPGFGKTTLVASYLEARRLPCLWYQLNADDADPGTVFHYLGKARERVASRKPLPLPQFTPESLPNLEGFTRRFYEQLFAGLPPETVLVFDNYHDVPPEAMFHVLVQKGRVEEAIQLWQTLEEWKNVSPSLVTVGPMSGTARLRGYCDVEGFPW